MTYRIDHNRIELLMRVCIDGATHAVGGKFSDADKENGYRIAKVAATIALEQFAAHINSELALLKFDHEQRLREAELRGPAPLIVPSPLK